MPYTCFHVTEPQTRALKYCDNQLLVSFCDMSRSTIAFVFLLALFFVTIRAQQNEQLAEIKLTVSHKLPTEQTFSKRGEISYYAAGVVGRYVPVARSLTEGQRKLLDVEKGVYQVKVEEERSGRSVVSFVKSCLLKASDFKDEIILHLDDASDFFHVDYYTEADACIESAKNEQLGQNIATQIQITRPSQGIKPTLSRITATKKGAVPANAPPAKAGAKGGESQPESETEEQEQTFFQKYWYIFAAITILAFISGGGEPPATAPTGVVGR
ncbi:hypothetical protein BC936DRAFT_141412, partial [Jimgerdemannia flammicorona]|uniref:Uncharacterized protein n=2 Tax=Jimgerdemannia flammicorona TaxID=994334 RepID=A0A433Q251_9FUNG